MPIRRSAGTPPQETPPSTAPEGEPDASSEESAASVEEEQDAPVTKEGEAEEEKKENGEEASGENANEEKTPKEDADKKEDKDGVKEKMKKVKRTIPSWATMSANKRAALPKVTMTLPKVDDILVEAIEACKERSGASAPAVSKYIGKKYPSLDLAKRKFIVRKALNRLLEKGAIKQLKGKGFSGSFAIGKQPLKPSSKRPTEVLGDNLPLIITRLCEPKEASYILIKKYMEQHFPQLNVEHRPDILKAALSRAVDKGYLEQITGKGASGTFQLKRASDKALLKGGALEEAIATAITAMNEPKTCSTAILRKFLVETHKDSKVYQLVSNLKRTLQRCKVMGWMEQITGNGLNGTYQLCYPYYPSPAVLFPDKHKEKEEKVDKPKRRKRADSDEEESSEEEESEEESEEEEPPPKRKAQRPPPKARRPPPRQKPRPVSQSRAKGKRPAPTKRSAPPAKKAAPPTKKPAPAARKPAPPAKRPAPPARKPSPPEKKPASPVKKPAPPVKKPAAKAVKKPPPQTKATPVKKAAPASKPKTPIAKKLTSRASKRPVAKKLTPVKVAAKPAVKAKPAARKSLRARK